MLKPIHGRRMACIASCGFIFSSLAGCSKTTPIKELASNAAKYKGQDVRIRGRVVSNISLQPMIPQPLYFVSDGTGQIAVLSSGGSPATDSEVTVQGVLKDVPVFALPVVGKFKIAQVMVEEKDRQESETK